MTALASGKKVLLFAGQDSEKSLLFNDLYELDLETKALKQIDSKDGKVVPPIRNSHSMTKLNDKKIIVFGGANEEGPLKDLYELDVETKEFVKVKLDQTDEILPMIEMHSAHIYKGTHLLIIGGRSLEVGKPLNEIAFSDTIYAIDLTTYKVSIFGKLPSALGSHVSAIIDDKYLIVYGGTNGYRFFDSILRYDIEEKEWTLMT